MVSQLKFQTKMKMKYFYISQIILLIITGTAFSQVVVDQKLLLIENSKTLYGNFKIELQVKCQNPPTARTLGSATIDIIYDSTKLRFINGSDWNSSMSLANGYTRFIQSNNSESGTNRAVRIGVLGTNVNINGGGDPPGYDLKDYYDTWVRANFIIINNSNPVSLIIKTVTNQIGFFENPHNEPFTNVINNQNLSEPINLINILLPVSSEGESFMDYKISNNFPNPFNPETTFKISVKHNTEFLIRLYDINSKLIYSDSRTFYVNNESFYKLKMINIPSGIYFIVFTSNQFSEKFKIAYLK